MHFLRIIAYRVRENLGDVANNLDILDLELLCMRYNCVNGSPNRLKLQKSFLPLARHCLVHYLLVKFIRTGAVFEVLDSQFLLTLVF